VRLTWHFYRCEGDSYPMGRCVMVLNDYEAYIRETLPSVKPGRGTISGAIALERKSIQIPDTLPPEFTWFESQGLGKQDLLGVPLLREGILIRSRGLGRTRPAVPRQADRAGGDLCCIQAVIAIENGRLFDETRTKAASPREASQQKSQFLANHEP